MRKKILVIWVALIITMFSLKDDVLVALPDIAHEDITKMSTSIKRNLQESTIDGLKNAMGGDDEIKTKLFDDKVSASNVSQDYPPNSGWGAQHYYDPTTDRGMWGSFQTAKSRANDLYKGALRVYCFSVPMGLASPTRPWEVFAQSLHLMHSYALRDDTLTGSRRCSMLPEGRR